MTDKAIICVDDEKPVLESLKEQLMGHFGTHYMIELAESSDEAWELIEELVEDQIDILIIVSDWLMPGMKGDEFLIKVHQHFPHIHTVLLTGQADEEAIERARQEANLYRYIAKPWRAEELVGAIKAAME
ncbi:MAG: response regulator [Chloroflexota bacterium]